MRAFIDARSVPAGTSIETDLAIIGGGPSGIALALALADTPIRMLMLESGGPGYDATTQALYAGAETGVPYIKLDAGRLRYLGGSSNHWGGYCRPLDTIDFEQRDWLPYSGWPFGREALEPYFARAQSLVEAGPFIYDDPAKWTAALGAPIPLGPWRHVQYVLPVQQTARQHSADAFRRALFRRPETRTALERDAACERDGPEARAERGKSQSSRRADADGPAFHGEAEICGAWRSAASKMRACFWPPTT